MLSRSQRKLRARLAAYTRSSQYDGRAVTAKARQTFLDQFEHQVDPDNQLPKAERARRAEAARKAHFTRLALRSARTRAKKIGAKIGAPDYLYVLPEAVPSDRVIVHNNVVIGITPTRKLGTQGFRAWLVPIELRPLLEVCECGWAPQLGDHFRIKREEVA